MIRGKVTISILENSSRLVRKLGLSQLMGTNTFEMLETIDNNQASNTIKSIIQKQQPAMIARFGVGELNATIRYAHIKGNRFNPIAYLFKGGIPGWWTEDIIKGMPIYNGFFPTSLENLERFGELMLNDIKQLDILGCWQPQERYFEHELENTLKCKLQALEPYLHRDPWSNALEGKKVLVIHPFEKSIRQQYNNRLKLFNDSRVLPSFELNTIKAVQSLAGNTGGYKNWFVAFENMKEQMENINFEVAIIGAGAYGFPLAAHAKRLGKIGIHLGGATQILFGIKGQRWVENKPEFSRLFNDEWIYPDESEKPINAEKVEGACYW